MKLSELAAKVGARLENCTEELEINGLAPIEEARPGQIGFVACASEFAAAKRTRASAIVLPSDFPSLPLPMLRGDDSYLIFARLVDLFHAPLRYEQGVHH